MISAVDTNIAEKIGDLSLACQLYKKQSLQICYKGLNDTFNLHVMKIHYFGYFQAFVVYFTSLSVLTKK